MSDLQRYFADKWTVDDATDKLYHTHDLKPDSIVFDVGAYLGEWTAEIAKRYNPYIFAFEPVPDFCADARARLSANPKLNFYGYGLASSHSFSQVALLGAASGMYKSGFDYKRCEFRYVTDAVLEVLGVRALAQVKIDLMAINIEGGEYDLLKAMSHHGVAYQCREIMVQFHPLWPDSYDRRNEIRALLSETHEEVWGYPFVWEKWRRR